MENNDKPDLVERTRRFSLNVIDLVDGLPRRKSATVIGKQLLRPATSVGANYRSARRGRSRAEFISKLNIALEEADELLYWIELLSEVQLAPTTQAQHLLDEAQQLVAFLTSSAKTARQNNAQIEIA